jgi:heme/copper-type cytochrome/quinol oxidase subunit 2
MNPDWPFYATLIGGAIIGGSLTLRKRANHESRLLRQWLVWSLALSVLIYGAMGILALSDTDAFREPWSSKTPIQVFFGFALILQVVITISGIILGLGVLFHLTCRARNDLK